MDFFNNPELIRSKMDFVVFLEELHNEMLVNPKGWQNNTLFFYLDGLGGATFDSDGLSKNQGVEPLPSTSWTYFARLMLSATMNK